MLTLLAKHVPGLVCLLAYGPLLLQISQAANCLGKLTCCGGAGPWNPLQEVCPQASYFGEICEDLCLPWQEEICWDKSIKELRAHSLVVYMRVFTCTCMCIQNLTTATMMPQLTGDHSNTNGMPRPGTILHALVKNS